MSSIRIKSSGSFTAGYKFAANVKSTKRCKRTKAGPCSKKILERKWEVAKLRARIAKSHTEIFLLICIVALSAAVAFRIIESVGIPPDVIKVFKLVFKLILLFS